MKKLLCYATFLIATVIGGSSLTSCSNLSDDNPVLEVTLEDALKDGTIVAFSFNLNGEDIYIVFIRVGDTYELLGGFPTRAEGDDDPSTPVLTEQDLEFVMEHDKANDLLKVTVTEKKTKELVMNAIIDIKASTIEIIPGDPKFKISGMKMKVDNVEITNLLKEKGEGVTLVDALVKGAKIEIAYKYNNNKKPTIFTCINEGDGKFSCQVTGEEAEDFEGSSMTQDGNVLIFRANNWISYDCSLRIDFNTATNTFKFMTITHDTYNSHTISVNGTDISSQLKEERI